MDDKTEVIVRTGKKPSTPIDKTVAVSPEKRKQAKPQGIDIENTVLVAKASQSTVVKEAPFKNAVSKLKPVQETTSRVGVGDCIKDRFELVEVLGIGGMGVVYRARDLLQKELGEKEPYLAFKVLNDQLSDNDAALIALQQECKKTQRLAHPNIVNVYDFDRDKDTVYMTMELLHGESLDQVIYKQGFKGKTYEELVPWVKAVGEALSYAHENHIVHSDLKPSNLFVTSRGVIKVFDFGIAKAMQSTEASEQNGLSALTPAYASAGMLNGHAPQASDDLYAFAIVIYQLLTGKHPYNKKNALQVLQKKLLPIKPKGLPDSAWKALKQALDPKTVTTLTVEQFLNGFMPKQPVLSRKAYYVMGIVALLASLLTGAWAYGLWQDQRYIDALVSGELHKENKVISELDEMPQARRDAILVSSREQLIDNTLSLVDQFRKSLNLHKAQQRVNAILTLFPDSQKLWDLDKSLQAQIHKERDRLERELTALEQNLLRFDQSTILKWFSLLGHLKSVEPEHPWIQIDKLNLKVKAAIHSQLFSGNPVWAQLLISSYKEFVMAPGEDVLKGEAIAEIVSLELLVARYKNDPDIASDVATELMSSGSVVVIDAELQDKISDFQEQKAHTEKDVAGLLNDIATQSPQWAEALQWSYNWSRR